MRRARIGRADATNVGDDHTAERERGREGKERERERENGKRGKRATGKTREASFMSSAYVLRSKHERRCTWVHPRENKCTRDSLIGARAAAAAAASMLVNRAHTGERENRLYILAAP